LRSTIRIDEDEADELASLPDWEDRARLDRRDVDSGTCSPSVPMRTRENLGSSRELAHTDGIGSAPDLLTPDIFTADRPGTTMLTSATISRAASSRLTSKSM
jgi:hypothetical protein